MKITKLVTIAAFLAAVALASPSAFAFSEAQAKAIKKAVTSVPVPEMPAKAAELVAKATDEDRHAVAVTAVRAAIFKSRSSAPQVVAAISKVAPKLAPIVARTAAQMETSQASVIARAATVAAPEAKTEIAISVSQGVSTGNLTPAVAPSASPSSISPISTPRTDASLLVTGPAARPTPAATTTRTSANHTGTPHGTITQTRTPIGGGEFTGYSATPVSGTPVVRDYTAPRSL